MEDFMEYIAAEEVKIFAKNPVCIVQEYESQDKDINIAVATISGRYPEKDWAMNEKCKEMAFVLKGSGKVHIEDRIIELSENDMVLILPNEKYYWEGNMTLLLPSSPAWYPGQYKVISQ